MINRTKNIPTCQRSVHYREPMRGQHKPRARVRRYSTYWQCMTTEVLRNYKVTITMHHVSMAKTSPWTYPPRFALVFYRLLCISLGGFDVVYWLFYIVLYPVNHLSLLKDCKMRMFNVKIKSQLASAIEALPLTRRALLWYDTAFFVSPLAFSTYSTAFVTLYSIRSIISPWNRQAKWFDRHQIRASHNSLPSQ